MHTSSKFGKYGSMFVLSCMPQYVDRIQMCVRVRVFARLLNGYVRVNKALCQITLKTGDERAPRHLLHEGCPSTPEQQ